MPIRSITDLRKQVGPDWKDVSDEDLITSYAQSIKADPAAVAYELGFGLSEGGKTSKRFGSSIDRYQAGLYGFGEELTKAVGLDSVSDYLGERRRSNELRANTNSIRAQQLGAVDAWKDVNSVSDFADYAVGLGIQSAPYLAEALTGGIVGRGLMTGTRAALSAARTSGDVAAATKATRALNVSSTAGAVGASYPSAVGDILGNQREQAGTTDFGTAAALGVPYALANAFGLEGAAARSSLFRNSINLLDKPGGFKGAALRAGATGVATGAKEGASEVFQEGMNQFGRMAVDPTEEFFSDAAQDRFKESFIGGAVLGGGTSAALGGWRRSQPANDIQQAFQQTNTGTTPTADTAPAAAPPVAPAATVPPAAPAPAPAPVAPVVQGGTTDIAQANQAAAAEDAAVQQKLQQQAAREGVYEQYGIANPQDPTKGQLFGQKLFGPSVPAVADAMVAATSKLPPAQQELVRAVAVANAETGNQLVKFAFNANDPAKSVAKALEAVSKVLTKFQIGHVQTVQEAAQILNTLSESAKGQQLEQIDAMHVALTGESTTGFNAAQEPKAKKGAANEPRQQVPVQNASGVGAVREQGAAGSAAQGNVGAVQPGGVQPVGAGSVPEGSLGLQTGQLPGEGVRTGTGGVPGANDGGGATAQAPQVTQGVQDGQITVAQTGAGQAQVQPAGAAADATGIQQPTGTAGQVPQAAAPAEVSDTEKLADQMESITDEVMKLLVPPTSRMNEETAQKQRDFVFTIMVNGQYAALEVMAADFGIKLSQAKDWSAKAGKLKEDPSKVAAAYTAIAESRGLTIAELMARINAKASQSVNEKQEVDESISTSREQGGPRDSDERKLRTEFDADGRETGEREVTDEGLAIKNRKSGSSVQERFNAVDTNQAKYLRLVNELEEAEGADNPDEAKIAELRKQVDEALARGVEQAKKRTKSEATGADTPPARATLSPEMRAASDKWKAVKGDLTKLTDDELKLVKERAQQLKNKELVGKVDAELAKRKSADESAAEGRDSLEKREAELAEKKKKAGRMARANAQSAFADRSKYRDLQDAIDSHEENVIDTLSEYGDDEARVSDYALGEFKKEVERLRTELEKEEAAAKPSAEVVVRTPQEQYETLTEGFPVPAFAELSEQQQEQITDLATREQLNLAAINRILSAKPKQLGDESNVVDVEARVVEETVGKQVLALPEPQVSRLERHYGLKRGTAEFLAKVKEDVVKYVNKGAEAVSAAIRDVIKAVANGVLAVALVFNPSFDPKGFSFNLPQAYAAGITETVQIRDQVPASAVAKMSPLAQQVYETMAPTAKKSGKGFIIADKPNGMIHFFNADGSVLVQDTALYGKDAGDVLSGKGSLEGGAKVTPAGSYSLRATADSEYAGGMRLDLVETRAADGIIAVHAAYLGDPKENRAGRLASASVADKKISYGCINTSHDLFLKSVKPNIANFNGGMIFVLPDATEMTAAMFPAQTQTTTRVETRTAANAESNSDTRSQPGLPKEEKRGQTRTASGQRRRTLFGQLGTDNKKVTNPYTAKELLAEIKSFVRSDIPGRKLVVVDSVEDLLNDPDVDIRAVAKALADKGAFGVAADGRAFLIANRIDKGSGRAKFMHEVGAHLGLENLLPKALYNKLVGQIRKWAESDADTDEAILAARAQLRVLKAKTPDADADAELLAYFIEEAIEAGIDPTATEMRGSSAMREWFRTLWAAFKVAIRKLGFKPEALTSQDIVDLAFGAARLEMAGTWHGTAAQFRRFSNLFMGAGEGNQAYGWGAYVAQRTGIAKEYWAADVRRKSFSRTKWTYGGKSAKEWRDTLKDRNSLTDDEQSLRTALYELSNATLSGYEGEAALQEAGRIINEVAQTSTNFLKQQRYEKAALWFKEHAQDFTYEREKYSPEGALLRVDLAIDQNEELLDWSLPMSEQSDTVKAAFEKFAIEVLKRPKPDWSKAGRFRGADYYMDLGVDLTGIDPTTKEQVAQVQKAASEWLDANGVKGIKYFDAASRTTDLTLNTARFTKDGKVLAGEDALLAEYFKPGEIVEGYGGPDKVIKFTPGTDTRGWAVTVIAVDKDGNPKRGERARSHFTTPDIRELRAVLEARGWSLDETFRTRNIVVFNDQNILRVGSETGADRQRMRFGVDNNIERLPKPLQQPTRVVTTNSWAGVKKAGLAFAITEDVVKLAQKTMKSAADYLKAQYDQQATRLKFELGVEKILQQYDKLPKNLQGTGDGTVNRFIYDSTLKSLWGFAPAYNPAVTIDPEMKRRFDAIKAQSPAAAKLIQDVFEHGHNALLAKQAAVKAAADKEFKESEARAAGDKAKLAEIALERKAFQAKFDTILKIKGDKPYAYLGRYGDYVVVAKSAQFIEAQKLARDGDKAAAEFVEKNQSNPDHYVVMFTETPAQAQKEAATLQGTGLYEKVSAAEKLASEAYTGGGDLFLAFKRMQNMLARKAKNEALDADSFNKLNKLMADMYLSAVAESSAHTSGLARKEVAGADPDMMRNLATRGRADAHFLAALQHGDDVTDALDRMIDEADDNRTEATPVLNELLKRQAASTEYKLPSTLAQNLTQLSTVYYLSTSPAFYVQQILQTAVLSLPFMAGRLGYFRSARAIQQAYGDVRQLVKGLGVNEHVDFSKAPADVRAMLETLVGMGKIDVGIDADAKARSSDQGVMSKVMRKLQGVNTRVESINRSVAAIAAYRAYKQKFPAASDAAAVQYAADVVSNTHGSYDGFNTPRVLSSDVGRVVGQFKRFQIIQLSMLGKLLHTAFKGASPEEKMVARASLRFITAHMAVLGGALGVPFVTQLGNILVGIFGDDDEPKDLEQKLRDLIGNEALATLLLRGVPASVGLESLGKKLAMENVASLVPFTDVNLADRDALTKVYVSLLGPSAALSLKMADGLGMMRKGELQKGMEMMLPNGIGNAMKGYRFASEGVTMRNGDTVMSADDISMVDAAFQAIGLPTTTITDRQRVQQVVAETDKFYEAKAAQIKRDYVKAFNNGDSGDMQDAREAWMELQDARQAKGYRRQPMSALFRAPMEQRKRENQTAGGVQFNRSNRQFVQELAQ